MKKIKVREAEGVVLDSLVALALGWKVYPSDSIEHGAYWYKDADKAPFGARMLREKFNPSTEWSQGGLIIDREGIGFYKANASRCWAYPYGGDYNVEGKTPLIATMRCFVISKLGEEVEVLEELLNEHQAN